MLGHGGGSRALGGGGRTAGVYKQRIEPRSSFALDMEYVVDVQGFKAADNEFDFKEVAIAALEDDPTPSMYSLKSPHRWDDLPS